MAKQAKQQVDVDSLTPEQRSKLMQVLKETSNALARVEGEKDYVREAKKSLVKDLGLPTKMVSKLVKVHHKQNFDQEQMEHEQFEKLYLKVTTKVS